jgi:hypothetical protein
MVGLGRLELPTSRLSSARSNQLSYKPKLFKGPWTVRHKKNGGAGSSGRKRNVDGGVPHIGLHLAMKTLMYLSDPIETREVFLKDHP